MQKQTRIVLAATLLAAMVAGTAHATLITIGNATNSDGYSVKLIWDNDAPFGSVVWLDNTYGGGIWWSHDYWQNFLTSDLTVHVNPGYTISWTDDSWRLPRTLDNGIYYPAEDGTSSTGYNITSSELGHLWYTELGNTAHEIMSNAGEFDHLGKRVYWSETEPAINTNNAYCFVTETGLQTHMNKESGYSFMFVRSAEVDTTPVPEPSTLLLVAGGLAGLVGWRMRQRSR